jgi:AmmeMemoRadiSam system protein A
MAPSPSPDRVPPDPRRPADLTPAESSPTESTPTESSPTESTPPEPGPPDRPDAPSPLRATDGEVLLDIAEASIRSAFHRRAPTLPADLPPGLAGCRGAFVTLHVAGTLNGCIGTITADQPLAPTVARLARSAAFDDPRLPATTPDDLARLSIEVSVLSPLDPVPARTRAQLRAGLQPGVHGLVLAAGRHRALFLPDVWAQFPDFDDFVDRLLSKASLDPRCWPPQLMAWRFTTQAFTRPAPTAPPAAPSAAPAPPPHPVSAD